MIPGDVHALLRQTCLVAALVAQVAEDAWHECDQDCAECCRTADPDVLDDARRGLLDLLNATRH